MGKKIKSDAKRQAKKRFHPEEEPELQLKYQTVDELLEKGRSYFFIDEYDLAELHFEKVLQKDSYNRTAMRFLTKIAERRYDISTYEKESTFADMIQEVRDTWNLPVRSVIIPDNIPAGQGPVKAASEAEQLREKMRNIVIPRIEFRSANIQDVVNLLVEESIAGDPDGVGINIVLNLNIPGEPVQNFSPPSVEATDSFDGDEESSFQEHISSGVSAVPTITLNLRQVKLLDAIELITEGVGLKYRVEKSAVIITPQSVVSGRVLTRIYPVQPSIIDVIVERQENEADRQGEFVEIGGRGTTIQRSNVKEFFNKSSVPFPVGTSITYNPSISALIVANTVENLDVFERILVQLNVIPKQVEIEARFVEVSQTDLGELGLEWILTDNYEVTQRTGSTGLAGAERIQINADSLGFTKALRFLGTGLAGTEGLSRSSGVNFAGDILSISSVLTNPELNIVLHALSQRGGLNVLSAPRVMARSGNQATIEVVQEIIYPTEFGANITVITGGGASDRQVVTVTPGTFETREIGVILNVTPTVGPDGYTIELTLLPEVAELVDWINYGADFEGQSYNIPQPIFASRNVTTTIVVWDGQTVAMGGLITERLVTYEDKIPLLGDIPILGRLFRTNGEISEKKNLIIFVTARVVDPAGKPVHTADNVNLPGAALSSE
ncbi:MAG: hypothetical protein GKR87_14995 [Kiritimatiellae bacterium]|nr:hypothetical protein [Kiritimatiellia bacterium]